MMRLDTRTLTTIGVFMLMYAVFAVQFPSMFSFRVVGNLLTDNAYLGILAVGMLVVVVSGGIDLSVGAVMTFASVLLAVSISRWGPSSSPRFASEAGLPIVNFPPGMGSISNFESVPCTFSVYAFISGSALASAAGFAGTLGAPSAAKLADDHRLTPTSQTEHGIHQPL